MGMNTLKVIGVITITLALTLSFADIGISGPDSESGLSMMISPSVIQYKVTKTIEVSGSGFTPDAVLSIGILGLGQQKKAPGSKDLWFGLARVDQSKSFAITVTLSGTLWRVKSLAGKYDVIAKDQNGEIVATAPLVVERGKPKK